MQEFHHNKPGQVRDYLQAGLDTLAELDIPLELREAAFVKAVELHASKSFLQTQPVTLPRLESSVLRRPRTGG